MSFLEEKGRPSVVERAFILPPSFRISQLTVEARQSVIKSSLVFGVYEKTVDRESAYEKLKSRVPAAEIPSIAETSAQSSDGNGFFGELFVGRRRPRGGAGR